MKIIIDANIPFIKGVLEPYADVVYLHESAIDAEAVKDADALLVRTHTRCNASLLDGSSVKFIGTGTIGTDHIDLPYCASKGIAVVNAPGCNAPAVAQYVVAAIDSLLDGEPTQGKTLGIVGVGNVGSLVDRWARSLGMKTLLCDPPRARRGDDGDFVDLATVAAGSDIITFHTPLTRTGEDASWHLADKAFFEALKPGTHIINAARGGVIDEAAMLASDKVGNLAIDCWESEPQVNLKTLDRALIATPHIAGYSRQGKTRATMMIVDALCRHFGLPQLEIAEERPLPPPAAIAVEAVRDTYDIMADDTMLRNDPDALTPLRNNYKLREETY